MLWKLFTTRKENKMTQSQIAELLGISKQAYYLKENGKTDFKLSEMRILANFFNKSLDELFR